MRKSTLNDSLIWPCDIWKNSTPFVPIEKDCFAWLKGMEYSKLQVRITKPIPINWGSRGAQGSEER